MLDYLVYGHKSDSTNEFFMQGLLLWEAHWAIILGDQMV